MIIQVMKDTNDVEATDNWTCEDGCCPWQDYITLDFKKFEVYRLEETQYKEYEIIDHEECGDENSVLIPASTIKALIKDGNFKCLLTD